MKNRGIGPVIIGLLLIILGLGYVGNVVGLWIGFTLFFRGWWTLFLILPCLIGLLNKGFSISKFVGLVVGLLFLVLIQTKFTYISALIWPVAIVCIGVIIIFQSRTFKNHRNNIIINTDKGGSFNIPSYTAIFAGKEVKISGGEVFKGAEITTFFGGVELDLRQSTIQDDITIDVSAIFGGIDIKVPVDVNIKTDVAAIFGGVDGGNRTVNADAPTIRINGSCVFGGLDIK